MRLHENSLSIEHKLWEFDAWVTPSLNEIKGTERYRSEMRRVLGALSIISAGSLPDPQRYSAEIVERVSERIRGLSSGGILSAASGAIKDTLESLSALIFLVTGKSDNNHKCQLPIFLKNTLGWESIPGVKKRGSAYILVEDKIPRVLDSDKYMSRVASMYGASIQQKDPLIRSNFENKANLLLLEFVDSVLHDEDNKNQLNAFIEGYINATVSDKDPSLILSPLIAFQVRGSVSASGGHEPEQMLRSKMSEWGMRKDIDYNSADVVVRSINGIDLTQTEASAEEEVETKAKTRAFDFVLPFKTPDWKPRIFIQSQFYAGDSGSVSHKNVDQTSTSRQNLIRLYEKFPDLPTPLFIEYVDGAGYCASLNRDLRSLLAYENTYDFFQIRTAPIRLRRILQTIGFLTPIDVLHALLRSDNLLVPARTILSREGYCDSEIDRAMKVCHELGYVVIDADVARPADDVLSVARQYLLLDAITSVGRPFASLADCSGCVLVPGYGPYYGIRLDEISSQLGEELNKILGLTFLTDLNALCDAGYAKLH